MSDSHDLNLVIPRQFRESLNKWGLDCADEISKLFHLNNQRIALWDPNLSLTWQSTQFKEKHDALGKALNEMKSRCDALLEADKIARAKKRKNTRCSCACKT